MNFGGFVPISTVDWRGRVSCVVFFRGCNLNCWFCQNQRIRTGSELVSSETIIERMKESRALADAVIFSGGEPTCQPTVLYSLAAEARNMGMEVGLHTNGSHPRVIYNLVSRSLVDYVAVNMSSDATYTRDTINILKNCPGLQTEAICIILEKNLGHLQQYISIAEGTQVVFQQGYGNGMLRHQEIVDLAKTFQRKILVRTKEAGEVVCE